MMAGISFDKIAPTIVNTIPNIVKTIVMILAQGFASHKPFPIKNDKTPNPITIIPAITNIIAFDIGTGAPHLEAYCITAPDPDTKIHPNNTRTYAEI